ncbi:RNA methyltransferase family protein [Theileria parva strain Muguga]|uniref:RNA methyltransferase family protein n=1 Tax=Theileria parva strain Muguga TaxID=333668 RepID=UPI001C61BC3B|nr:RNA methyltransferase family protein [Theileria parva strain Muguga]KAF5153314.1 RNA methyltransferase family protein [Theileria parva strain Muguga]
MNLILFRYSDIVDSESTLTVDIIDKNTVNHLLNVLKVHVGKLLKVGILNSTLDYGVVESITKWSIKLKLSENFRLFPPVIEKPVVDLVVGIPRPKSLDKLLQYSASIGVGNIDLICSSRVEKSYLASHKLSKESINKSLILGLQQGVCTLMPEVNMYLSMGEYERACKQKDYAMKLIAHPDSEETLGSLKLNTHVKGPILVAIGPEGGWLDHELTYYKKLGFVQFKLTDRILRTEVAAAAILSQMSLLLNDTTLRNGLEPAKR